jgi:hypothetical protein
MNIRAAKEVEIDQLAKIWYDGRQDAHAEILPARLKWIRTLESFRERLAVHLLNTMSAVLFLLGFIPTLLLAQDQTDCTVPAGGSSNLGIDSGRLCLDNDPTDTSPGKTVRLIGYAALGEVCGDDTWSDDANDCSVKCQPLADVCSSPNVIETLTTLQVNTTWPKTGANVVRIFALGGSCNKKLTSTKCLGYGGREQTMPFERLANGKFNVKFKDNTDPGVDGELNKCWEARFRAYLREAEKNGILVIVSLFDENTMTGAGSTSPWLNNPWNPSNNNSGIPPGSLPTSGSGLPAFYNICPGMTALTGAAGKCADSDLFLLGKIQKKYVTRIADAVKKSGVRNVMFEVMNEARIGTGQFSGSKDRAVVLAAWHNTVASWSPDFLWVASVKKDQDQDMRLLSECQSNNKCLDSNPLAGNGNPFLVNWRSGIDVLMLHFPAWRGDDEEGDICAVVPDAFRFGKPVIFDDDGGPDIAQDNNQVRSWARTTCSKAHGSIHFFHTKDGIKMPRCEANDDEYIDCTALDRLSNMAQNKYVGPTNLCGKIKGGMNCPTRSNYCDFCHQRVSAKAVPEELPNDGQMYTIKIDIELLNSSFTAKLVSITANESLAPGDIQNATIDTDDRTFDLLAKTSGTGRLYTIEYEVKNPAGNPYKAEATVTVLP